MTIQKQKIGVWKTIYLGDLEGKLEDVISTLQKIKADGWECTEEGSEYGTLSLYKEREETDEEYHNRINLLQREEKWMRKQREKRLKELKKEIDQLSEEEKKEIGVNSTNV